MTYHRETTDDSRALIHRAAVSVLAFALLVAANGGAIAQQERAAGGPSSSAEGTSVTQGEVRKVDREAMKLTIRHGPLRNLDMPAMTMVFHVKDPAMLEQLKAGDQIEFVADRVDGAFAVIQVKVRR